LAKGEDGYVVSGPHHGSIEDLQIAVDGGCYICTKSFYKWQQLGELWTESNPKCLTFTLEVVGLSAGKIDGYVYISVEQLDAASQRTKEEDLVAFMLKELPEDGTASSEERTPTYQADLFLF
jgi:hypothetical protein